MNEEKLREYFDAYYDIRLHDGIVSREEAWKIWRQASKITEAYIKNKRIR